jgi:hypothetical protein
MSAFTFKKATRKQAKARVAIDGPSGSGKTYTSLLLATQLADGGNIAVIDTERGSASLYADKFCFDVLELNNFSPAIYVQAIHAAEQAGYKVIVLDSLSHAWEGEGGALEMVDNISAKSKSQNTYFAWRDVTPLHRKLVDSMLQSPCHIIATMRSKTEYIIENVGGKSIPRKIGMAPIQRAGMEYEFTLVADMDVDHKIVVSKSRCDVIADKVTLRPGADFWLPFVDWLNSGDAAPVPALTTEPTEPTAQVCGEPAPRPYSPEQLKNRLKTMATALEKEVLMGTEAQTVAMNLADCFGGNEDKLRTVVFYLTGSESLDSVDDDILKALKKWVNPTRTESGWVMDGTAVIEALAAYDQAMKEQGLDGVMDKDKEK